MESPAVLVVAASPVTRAGLAALLLEAGYGRVEQAAGLGQASDPGGHAPAMPAMVVAAPASAAELDDLLDHLLAGPLIPVLVLGPVGEEERLVESLSGRVWGYIRPAGSEALRAALGALFQGMTVLDPAMGLVPRPDAAADLLATSADDSLTAREREVLRLIGDGLANKQIAQRLGISEHTAKFHVASVLAKLGAATRAEAVRIGAVRGLLPL